MAYIKYDTEQMRRVKQTYTQAVTAMENMKTDMQAMVESVKTGWQSDAGDAFFKKYTDEWLKGFDQYMEVLQHMAENLDTCSQKYDEITREAEKLKIE